MLRESLTCSRYAMLNASTLEPFPDFFSTMLWRQVVGPEVLHVSRSDGSGNRGDTLRLYARCGRAASAGANRGVVVVAVSLSPNVTTSLTTYFNATRTSTTKREWQLTAANAPQGDVSDWGSSRVAALNGQPLLLLPGGEAPPLPARETSALAPVLLAPLSVTLIEYDIDAPACRPAEGARVAI